MKGVNIDIVPLLEWVDRKRVFDKEEAKKPQRTDKKEKPKSWEELWLEEQQRRAKFDEFMKVLKKQMADEPKKKEGWSIDHIAMLLMTLMPVNWLVLWYLLK